MQRPQFLQQGPQHRAHQGGPHAVAHDVGDEYAGKIIGNRLHVIEITTDNADAPIDAMKLNGALPGRRRGWKPRVDVGQQRLLQFAGQVQISLDLPVLQ